MIHEFSTKDMSDLIYDDLSTIQDNEETNTEVVLTTPTIESKFPCRVIDTPLESVNNTENAIPIRKTFQVSIEHWTMNQECVWKWRITQTKNYKQGILQGLSQVQLPLMR